MANKYFMLKDRSRERVKKVRRSRSKDKSSMKRKDRSRSREKNRNGKDEYTDTKNGKENHIVAGIKVEVKTEAV